MNEHHDNDLKILIVEDDIVDKKLLERLLKHSSLLVSEVRSAGSLGEAISLVQSEAFDIILSDLGLPDSVGTNAIDKLNQAAPHIPIVVMSGRDDEATAIHAVQLGAQDYLIKGQVDSQILVRVIRYAVERKKAEQKLQLAEQNYRLIFENSAVAIMMVNQGGQLVSWNQFTADLLEMTEQELYLCPVDSFYPKEEWQKICDENIREKGMQHHLETRMVKKSGIIIDVDISISVLKDPKGHVTGSIGVIRDVTERKEAEARLDQSYALLNATLESTADGLLAVDNEGNITHHNQTFSSMWGFSEAYFETINFDRLLRAMGDQLKDAPVFLAGLTSESLGESSSLSDKNAVLVCKDGRVIEHFSKPQYVAGQIAGRVLSFRDATERYKAEKALFKSEERFRQVVENAQEWIWEVDANGLFTYVSPVVEKNIGFKPNDLLGQKYFFDLFDPEERETLKEQAFEVFARKDRFREFETKIRDIDGNTAWLLKSGVPLLDEHGELVGYRGVDIDITERKRVQEILHRKQKNLEAIFDAAPIGMLLIDSEMKVRRANDAVRRMTFKDYPDILDHYPGRVLGCANSCKAPKNTRLRCGDGRACLDCKLFSTIKGSLDEEKAIHGVEINPRIRINKKDIHPWLSISTEALLIDGETCVVVAIDDITARVRAEKELRETIEIKSQFISTVSHELRTPLAAMKEAVLIVSDGVAGPLNNDQGHFLGVAKRNIDRLWRLINEVLDFQKLGTGKMKFRMNEGDLVHTVEEAYNTMIHMANKGKINLALDIQPGVPMAVYDSDRMMQVLTNLISNAIKFTPENGCVTVGVRCVGEKFVLSVRDSGMGIPKNDLSRIFDRFYQVNRSGAKEIKGTGLGLAIVHRIVEAHGGHVHVQSEMGKGTTFTIHMPVKMQQGTHTLTDVEDEAVENAILAG